MEKLRVSAKKFVTIDAIRTGLTPFMGDVVGIDPDAWKVAIEGGNGKRFAITFNFLPLANARLVNKAMGSLKLPDGSFRQFSALGPDDNPVELRLDRDENSKARTQRRMSAVVRKAIATIYPNRPNVHQRRNNKMDRVTIYSEKNTSLHTPPDL